MDEIQPSPARPKRYDFIGYGITIVLTAIIVGAIAYQMLERVKDDCRDSNENRDAIINSALHAHGEWIKERKQLESQLAACRSVQTSTGSAVLDTQETTDPR